jgi:hypothetical protein
VLKNKRSGFSIDRTGNMFQTDEGSCAVNAVGHKVFDAAGAFNGSRVGLSDLCVTEFCTALDFLVRLFVPAGNLKRAFDISIHC